MFEIIRAGGWLMWPILGCSVIAMAIVLERAWILRRHRVAPPHLVPQVLGWIHTQQIDTTHIDTLRSNSPLGRILAAGLIHHQDSREVMKESIEETGRHVVAELERFLNTLGTISEVSPLLGLLGTTFGMIQTFNVISAHGVGNPALMSSGIAVALITTAAGLSVAIPALLCHRYFQSKVDALVITMEQEALRLVETLHSERVQRVGADL
ncbi:biopolymer transport protein ExbB [Gammaproteobacteria bacterium]